MPLGITDPESQKEAASDTPKNPTGNTPEDGVLHKQGVIEIVDGLEYMPKVDTFVYGGKTFGAVLD